MTSVRCSEPWSVLAELHFGRGVDTTVIPVIWQTEPRACPAGVHTRRLSCLQGRMPPRFLSDVGACVCCACIALPAAPATKRGPSGRCLAQCPSTERSATP